MRDRTLTIPRLCSCVRPNLNELINRSVIEHIRVWRTHVSEYHYKSEEVNRENVEDQKRARVKIWLRPGINEPPRRFGPRFSENILGFLKPFRSWSGPVLDFPISFGPRSGTDRFWSPYAYIFR